MDENANRQVGYASDPLGWVQQKIFWRILLYLATHGRDLSPLMAGGKSKTPPIQEGVRGREETTCP